MGTARSATIASTRPTVGPLRSPFRLNLLNGSSSNLQARLGFDVYGVDLLGHGLSSRPKFEGKTREEGEAFYTDAIEARPPPSPHSSSSTCSYSLPCFSSSLSRCSSQQPTTRTSLSAGVAQGAGPREFHPDGPLVWRVRVRVLRARPPGEGPQAHPRGADCAHTDAPLRTHMPASVPSSSAHSEPGDHCSHSKSPQGSAGVEEVNASCFGPNGQPWGLEGIPLEAFKAMWHSLQPQILVRMAGPLGPQLASDYVQKKFGPKSVGGARPAVRWVVCHASFVPPALEVWWQQRRRRRWLS